MGKWVDLIKEIPGTCIRIISSPSVFFRDMPKKGGIAPPFVFLVVMALASGVLSGLLRALESALGMRLYEGAAMGFLSLTLIPVASVIGSALFGFLAAAALFVIWRLMGSKEDYEAAYRCTAYLSAVMPISTLVGFAPYVGGALGLALILYYLVTASVSLHGIPPVRAWICFGVIAALLMIISVSSRITAKRFARNMEQAEQSWKDASQEMRKSVEEMRKQMKEQMKEGAEKKTP